jgi:hypothetical protein
LSSPDVSGLLFGGMAGSPSFSFFLKEKEAK